MSVQENSVENNKLLREIALLLKLQNSKMLEEYLNKVAVTKERKIMWTMLDGNTKIIDIAKRAGTSVRTVQVFIKELEKHGLVEPIRSTPRRKIDFVPPPWLKKEVKKDG